MLVSFKHSGIVTIASSRHRGRSNRSPIRTLWLCKATSPPRAPRKGCSTSVERFGRVDTLVNNAGMFMAKPFTLYSQDDYAIYMATNVTGFFHMTQRALELMRN